MLASIPFKKHNKFTSMFFVLSTGLDSTPNDGIYTGVLTANQMAGDGYYNIRVSLSIYINIVKLKPC